MALKPPPFSLVRIHGVRVKYVVSPKWHAKRRLNLKQALNEFLTRHQRQFVSLSHTRHLGGFACSTTPVGFDLEPAERTVSKHAAIRFATPQELKKFKGSALAVWVAKEAAFKSLRGLKQPQTVTAIGLERIRFFKKNNGTQLFFFRFKLNNYDRLGGVGAGRCEISRRTIMGFALFNP